MAISKKELEEMVTKKARQGKLSCTTLLKLADELGVKPKRLGDACNAVKVHIVSCQLGCFK